MRKLQWFALLSVCGLSTLLFADQVVLNNGDRLTGTITKSDGKTLVIKTESARGDGGEDGCRSGDYHRRNVGREHVTEWYGRRAQSSGYSVA
jgi:hypothetical protein